MKQFLFDPVPVGAVLITTRASVLTGFRRRGEREHDPRSGGAVIQVSTSSGFVRNVGIAFGWLRRRLSRTGRAVRPVWRILAREVVEAIDDRCGALMARKLKTYQTSLGFFEQAIAAPSMKAALEAWGADSNLFHQGAAQESTDPDVIAATMKKVVGVGGKAVR